MGKRKKIELGDHVRDEVTGFEGTATGRFEYANGCVRYMLEGPDSKGDPAEHYFDEQRIVHADGRRAEETATAGGPMPTPPAMPTP